MDNLVLATPTELRRIFRSEMEDFFSKLNLTKEQPNPESQDFWGDIDWLCGYLPDKPAKSTIYALSREDDTFPKHKRGKHLYFLKSEIDSWLKSRKVKSKAEIAADRDRYLTSIKK